MGEIEKVTGNDENDHVDDVFACSMIALNNAKKNKEDLSGFQGFLFYSDSDGFFVNVRDFP